VRTIAESLRLPSRYFEESVRTRGALQKCSPGTQGHCWIRSATSSGISIIASHVSDLHRSGPYLEFDRIRALKLAARCSGTASRANTRTRCKGALPSRSHHPRAHVSTEAVVWRTRLYRANTMSGLRGVLKSIRKTRAIAGVRPISSGKQLFGASCGHPRDCTPSNTNNTMLRRSPTARRFLPRHSTAGRPLIGSASSTHLSVGAPGGLGTCSMFR
jgi:hypothetical protein